MSPNVQSPKHLHRFFCPALATARLLMFVGLVFMAGTISSALPVAAAAAPNLEAMSAPGDWPHETSDLTPDPAVTYGRLKNGFRYVLMKNSRPENRVSLHLYIGAGSLNETEDQRGLAHYLEHMLFNGSTHFPPGELIRYFQGIGMQFGNDANAHTGFDETVYDIILPSGDRPSLEKGLLVMQDYAMGALLLEEEVERERGIILAEKRSRDSSAYRTFVSTLNFELPQMRLVRRLPIGTEAVIKSADRKRLKAFYDAWYRPDNSVLVMVGDFTIPLAKELIEKRFQDFQPRAVAPPLPEPGTIDHRGLKTHYHHEPETGGTTVSIEVLSKQAPELDSKALQQRTLAEQMADGIVQNRLDALLTKPDAPFTSAAIGSGTYLNQVRYAEITADSRENNWQATLTTLEQELRRARQHGFTAAELDRVQKDILSMLDNSVKAASTRDSTGLARSILRHLTRNRVFQSPAQEQAILAPMAKAVTLDDLRAAFARNWPDDHRLVLVTGKADLNKADRPDAHQQIRTTYQSSTATQVAPPSQKAALAFPYLPPPADTGTVAETERIEDLGITRVVLGNGIRINIKATDFEDNEIVASLVFGAGKAAEPASLPGLSRVGGTTLNESGFGAMDATQLEEALAGKSTYVDFSVRENHFSIFSETVSDELPLMFQLLYAQLVDPGFREEILKLVRERLRQEYQSLSHSIEGQMAVQGRRFLAGGDSRFGLPAMERIDAIGLDEIRNWILPPLQTSPLELSVVGDLDEKEVIELARRYLGSLASRQAAAPSGQRSDLPRVPTGVTRQIKVETQIDKAMVVAAWATDDFWDIHQTRRLSVLADLFSERLRLRIREKLGASYSPFAYNRSSRAYDGYGLLQAHVSAAPEQTDTILAEVRAIAAELAKGGTTPEELARIVDPILTSIKELRQTNGYWLNSVLTGSARHPQQIEWARSFIQDYGAVTPEEIHRLAVRYLDAERAAAIVISPVKQPPKKES